MYRKDVLERNIYKMESKEKESDAKPNFAKMAREMGCDYRTAKSAWLKARDGSESAEAATRKAKPSKIDPFRAIIGEELEKPCTAMALYGFIKTLGYSGGYWLNCDPGTTMSRRRSRTNPIWRHSERSRTSVRRST